MNEEEHPLNTWYKLIYVGLTHVVIPVAFFKPFTALVLLVLCFLIALHHIVVKK